MSRANVQDDLTNSSRSSSAATSKGVSEGRSSDSGVSDITDLQESSHRNESSRLTKDALSSLTATAGSSESNKATSLALEAATAHCSMCEDAISALLCTQCGRLSFCVSCCVSLHDNKFLCTHKLIALDPLREGTVVTLAELKERSSSQTTKKPATTVASLPSQDASTAALSAPLSQKTAAHVDPTHQSESDETSETDIATLAADRNIIQARLAELASCRGLLQKASDGLSTERFQCRDIAQTAIEAVRRRFEVLRQVVAEKEGEFIAAIERAAKLRLEDATKSSFDAAASLAECDAFLEQTKLQLDRVSSNKKLFAEARTSMLLATDAKLRSIDDTIHRLQHDLDRIVSSSLGMHINLDNAIEEVRRLVAPQQLQGAHMAEVHSKPIPSEKFVNSPAVKVVRQRSAEALDQTATVAATHRKSYQQELEALRNTPLKDIRAGNASVAPLLLQAGVPGDSRPSTPRKQLMTHPSSANSSAANPGLHSSGSDASSRDAIAKIAQKYASSGNSQRAGAAALASSKHAAQAVTAVPRELERLRQVVASTAAGLQRKGSVGSAAGQLTPRGRSPASFRADSPSNISSSRVSSPMRSTQLTAYRSSFSPARHNPDATPGPGAYYIPTDFTARSMLSTPPRRR